MIRKKNLKKPKNSKKQRMKSIFEEYRIEGIWKRFVKVDPFVPKWPWEVEG